MAGWTGATYAHVPRREHIRRFRALLPSLLRRAEIARDVARGRMGTALFEGALELLGRGCYLVAPGGRIVHANRAGAQALAAPELRTAIASATRLAAPPGHHVMEIESRGMRPMRLVVVEQSAVPELASVELTGRQREVAQLLCTGASNHQIADELGISERTVEVHLTRVYDRLGVQQRASAIARLLGRRR
jgi:DNA-binding CsgD family transcriptional regulator